mmetsp:Transcript_93520/g.185543  ORF Transcript_93520/g.185543 Transcript_93520/m.185543 type:complete len:210 (+) Transcript_93520:234-863(+)
MGILKQLLKKNTCRAATGRMKVEYTKSRANVNSLPTQSQLPMPPLLVSWMCLCSLSPRFGSRPAPAVSVVILLAAMAIFPETAAVRASIAPSHAAVKICLVAIIAVIVSPVVACRVKTFFSLIGTIPWAGVANIPSPMASVAILTHVHVSFVAGGIKTVYTLMGIIPWAGAAHTSSPIASVAILAHGPVHVAASMVKTVHALIGIIPWA